MNVSPFARSWIIVTMKFTEPSSEEVIRKTMPMSHTVWPIVAMSDNGGYDVHPEFAAPPGITKLVNMVTPPSKIDPVAHHIELWKRHVGRADLQRHHIVSETADGKRNDSKKDHDRSVHRAQLIVKFRKHDPLGARSSPSHEPMIGIGWPGYASCQRMIIISVNPKRRKRRLVKPYLNANHLMVLGKNIFPPKP